MGKSWIGVDLDKTLAYQKTHEWKGPDVIGRPIPQMLMRVKGWIKEGKKVKIFTARVKHGQEAIDAIQDWCESVGLPRLDVVNEKDHDMICLWDDRVRRVEPNTGREM